MSHKIVAQLIKEISGQNNTLAIPRVYIRLLGGDIEAALFLSQCVYWSDKTKNRNGFYKTAAEWEIETGLTRYKVSRCAKACQQWVKTSLHRANGAPTLHYLVNLSAVCDSVSDLLETSKTELQETSNSDFEVSSKSELQETSKSLTEITQKITLQREGASAPKPPPPQNTPAPNPALQAVLDVTGKRAIPLDLQELISDLVGSNPNRELLRQCWQEWAIIREYKKTNWNWLFEWYKNGGVPKNGNGNHKQGEKTGWAIYSRI